MKELNIDDVAIFLTHEKDNIRVKSGNENVLLINQRIENVADLIKSNLEVVKNHYKRLASKSEELLSSVDINHVSLSIVLHYLYLYNSWKNMYEKQENRSLSFDEKDLESPGTHDMLFHYFKSNYPKDWKIKSAILLNIGLDELEKYYKSREEFYNK